MLDEELIKLFLLSCLNWFNVLAFHFSFPYILNFLCKYCKFLWQRSRGHYWQKNINILAIQIRLSLIFKMLVSMRVFMWQLYTLLFASSYIWLAYIFEARCSTVVTSVSKKSSVHQSELEKQVMSYCHTYHMVLSAADCWRSFKGCIITC